MTTDPTAALIEQAMADALWAERTGLPERAITAYRQAVSLAPGMQPAQLRLAILLLGLQRHEEAQAAAAAACALQPDDPQAQASLGEACLRLDQPERAIACLQRAINGEPALHRARKMLADALLDTGQAEHAVRVWREAETRFPDNLDLLRHMASFYQRAGLGAEAERCLLRLQALDPGKLATSEALVQLYLDTMQFGEAISLAEEALKRAPDSVILWNALACSHAAVGRMDAALPCYRRVLELDPRCATTHSSMLLTLHYIDGIDPQDLFAEHCRFGARHAPPALAATTFANPPQPGRRIRIGYMSPDIRRHSVTFFLEPLLDCRDRERFEVYCYAFLKVPDEVTQRLRAKFDHFRIVPDLRDAEIASLIRADQVDILIDLTGHVGNNHAPVLAYKPAPVQVNYLGYPDTLGIEAVDYRITDWISDPAGAEATHVETLVRLPDGFHCYRPPQESLSLSAASRAAGRPLTFGSFNREFKVSDRIVDLWCEILQALPDARLMMKCFAGNDPATREFQLGRFERRGVARERVELSGFRPSQADHLATYQAVDIALDTFPYHGTTTTVDALLMGIPVITLAGYNHASRVGASLLTQVGLEDLVARSGEQYVERAVGLARDPARLDLLHQTLRQRLLASPLCDGPAFCRKYEFALQGMWYNWCRAQGAALSVEQAAAAAFDFGSLPISGQVKRP